MELPNEFDLFRSFLLSFDLSQYFPLLFSTFAYCMTKYHVEIKELLSRIVETEARNEEQAVRRVGQMYRNGEIILDASDYIVTEISAKK